MADKQAKVSTKVSDETFEYWRSRPYISDELRQQLAVANVLMVPSEGYGDRPDWVYFPSQTEEFYRYLRNCEQPDLRVDICIEDEGYRELALHADLLVLAKLFVEQFIAPVTVDLIADFIKRRAGKREKDTEVRSTLMVRNEHTGQTVIFNYEGPAEEYRAVMKDALRARLAPPQAGMKALPQRPPKRRKHGRRWA